MAGNSADSAVDDLNELMHLIVRKYVDRFTNSHGQIDLKKPGGMAGVLPPSKGGNAFIDHSHSGVAGQGQKLNALNTHEAVALGPTAAAIHWQRAAIQALIDATPPAPTTLAALTDVAITNPTQGDVLIYDTGKWRNYRPEFIGTPGNSLTWDNGIMEWDASGIIWG